MYLEKITRKDLQNFINIRKNVSKYWKNKNLTGLYFIKDKKKIIGIISFKNYKEYLYINMIEIFYKNKGYGRKTVNLLLETYDKKIKGVAKDTAEIFWIKMGAFFENSFKFTLFLKENKKVS